MPTDWVGIVRNSLSSNAVLELPRRIKLPVVPQSIVKFTSLSENPNMGPRDLAVPLEADAALTTELLRQVNSAAYGLRQQVVSVAQAINLLGTRRTKTLVLTAALQSASEKTSSRLLNMVQFHRDNRMRAMFAREAARAIGAEPEMGYIAGLLQDFLLPLLMAEFESDYRQLLRSGEDLVEAEKAVFGWDHASVAADLMRTWKFPDELIVGVLWHHSPERIMAQPELTETVATASAAAGALPDGLCQSPRGFATLLTFQEELPDFCFLEMAGVVDEELTGSIAGNDSGLVERLSKLAEENLEQRRVDRVQRQRTLGSYTLEEEIGQGGMGVVYKASHCMLKRAAAIKILNSANMISSSLARFESEVQLTCRLTSPNTIAVYDYGATPEGLFYYAMEYLDGITLAQLVREDGPQSAGRVIHLLQQVCNSLSEAHSLGLIHRDLKPENMMLCCRGGVPDMLKVLDFGLAQIVSEQTDDEQQSTGFCGTPLYMPPEAVTSPQSVDVRSDIYSLGVVAYYLLTGEPVFSGPNVQDILLSHVNEAPERPSQRRGSAIDPDLEALVMQCLEKEPCRRPQNMRELEAVLSQCQAARSWSRRDASEWWVRRPAIASVVKMDTSPGELTTTHHMVPESGEVRMVRA